MYAVQREIALNRLAECRVLPDWFDVWKCLSSSFATSFAHDLMAVNSGQQCIMRLCVALFKMNTADLSRIFCCLRVAVGFN